MKLATHYNKASIIISISVLLLSGVVYYMVINHIAKQQLDSNLSEELAEVIDYVNINRRLPKPVDFDEDQTVFIKTSRSQFDTRFFDTPYINPKEKEAEEGRAISALIKLNDEKFIVTITESRKNTEYLVSIISGVTIILAFSLLVILIVTNTYVLNGLWRPFYYTLYQVKNFNIADPGRIDQIESRVDEFRELSDALAKMSARVSSDYQGLKIFTENASHEMMTPLAVMISKLDMLIQDETLRGDQLSQITEIYYSVNKLARLNQSLLLLVKIDNNLLPDTETLNLQSVIFEKLQQFQELIGNKKIALEISFNQLEINANRYLIDVLINNLFSNAIRHSNIGGKIAITIIGRKLLFKNTSTLPPLNKEMLFERFYKGKESEGTGLGLAIVKNICNRYHMELSYNFTQNMHSFEIDVSKNMVTNRI